MKRLLSLFLAFFLLAPAGSVLAKEAAPSTNADPALWVVRDKDTTIYLFGTVHVLTPGIQWFGGKVKAAFDRSDELVVEVVEPPKDAMLGVITKLGVNAEGPALSTKLTPEAREKYARVMTEYGLPWQSFERFDPWLPAMTLAVAPFAKLGYSADEGAEKILQKAATDAGKPVTGLETVEQQLGYFDGLPEDQQIAFLNATVDEIPGAEKEFATLIDHWKAGEPEALADELNESMETTPELADVLLFQRNARWAEWIKQRMDKPGTVFVAVGAGHLAGAKSVQDRLKAMGIKAERRQ